jgi:hypothetical protein
MSSPIGYALIEIKLVERAGMSAVRRRTFMDRDPHRVPQIMSARRHGEGSGNRSLLKTGEIQSPIDNVIWRQRALFWLFADILRDLGTTVAAIPAEDFIHRASLRDSAKALYLALQTSSKKAAIGSMFTLVTIIIPMMRRALSAVPTTFQANTSMTRETPVAASEHICGLAEAAVHHAFPTRGPAASLIQIKGALLNVI